MYERENRDEEASMPDLPVQSRRIDREPRPDHARSEEDQDVAAFDPVQILKRSLRGRVRWVAGLSLAGLIVGALIGWFAEKPQYKSEAVISIAYQLPPVISETDRTQPMAMFDSYMRTQELRLTSQDLAEKTLKKLLPGQAVTMGMIEDVADRLTVEHPAGTELLRISYLDPDREWAMKFVNGLIDEFQDEYNHGDTTSDNQRIALLEKEKDSLNDQLAACQKEADAVVINTQTSGVVLMSNQLATAEQMLNYYTQLESQLTDRLQQMRQPPSGLMENNIAVIETKSAIERAHLKVTSLQDDIQRMRARGANDASGGTIGQAPAMGVAQAPAQTGGAQTYDESKLKLDRLNQDTEVIRGRLTEVTGRIESLKLEMGESRLDTGNRAEIPLSPFRDRRRVLGWMGGTLGACLPTLVLVLMGLMRPRYRYSDETLLDVAGPAGLLGILPVLPSHLTDPECAAGAAQCVHQMRVMLQLAANGKPKQYLMTSACAGEGKTSLTLALGLSFAASGSRTLVVDGDLVGRALTRGFGAGNEQGLYEALGSGDYSPYIRQTSSGLWFLPSGRANALHASKISGQSVKNFLATTRREFDVVLVDSGPILGSVEAATFAPEVDSVMITVSRGQQPALVEKMTRHLRSIGARIEGYIFNRANSKDFFRSSYASSVRPMSSREMMVRVLSSESDGLLRFGPLVESVMSSLPANQLDDEESLQVHERSSELS